ncbi:MAG: DUF3320 domain-containing protein [Planctomycetes bacterium]|nr:DUF3320 domain-containing protein [Planctomycetota bacterium]
MPTLQLNWHYRSQHESLIAFSNWNYYGNQLVTFPSAESANRGVSLYHVTEGLYDRGKSRTNRREAEAIVRDAVERMQQCLLKPDDQRLTYGVVTFNSQQQELIQDLFDEALRQNPELEWFFSDERFEPTAVKNLENVQGDERDVMLFSITFGYDAAGKFPVDFGAINRSGGERRLNVAITRARRELVVYCSFLPDQFRAERSAARGIQDLKAFLEFAQKGAKAIIARTAGSLGGYESPLEEAIAQALLAKGWNIEPQVGVSGFRIDLGILHPDKPGAYLAGLECDGAAYHRSAVARDRDKIRQQVLESLGWTILRAWSTDWWYDPETALQKIDAQLRELLENSRAGGARPVTSKTPGLRESQTANSTVVKGFRSDSDSARPTAPIPVAPAAEPATTDTYERPLVAKQVAAVPRLVYPPLDLPDASPNQSRFFDDAYAPELRELALSILKSHGPMRDDVLAREVAKAHGYARTSFRIKQRVLDLLQDIVATDELVGRFLWPGPHAESSIPFRYASNDENRRSIDEIALAELLGLIQQCPHVLAHDDRALALAREIGLARLASPARQRLEEALEVFDQKPQTPTATDSEASV